MSAARAAAEWQRALAVLRPELAERMRFVAIAADGPVALPANDPKSAQVAALLNEAPPRSSSGYALPRWIDPRAHRWSAKTFEIWKILLEAWLRREAPLPLHEIQRRAGASYPSVAKLLAYLQASGEIERPSSRSVAMVDLPRRTLAEVLALRHGLRQTYHFYDRVHGSPDLFDLVRRVAAKVGDDAGLGGVEGARHYMPSFDLNGLPRIDLTIAEGVDAQRLVKKIDPALALAPPNLGAATQLVVHVLGRPVTRFERSAGGSFADPAEVLLDLHELRLVDQAAEFVRSLRARTA